MGNDGSIKLSRKDLIVNQTPTAKHNSNSTTIQTVCHLSNDPLSLPLVSDYKGNIYNKIAMLEYLINPESYSSKQKELVEHIKTKRDIVELNIKRIDKDKTADIMKISCPITGDILGQTGGKFGYVVNCGDVFAIRSLKELKESNSVKKNGLIHGNDKDSNEKEDQICPVCDSRFEDDDLIIIGAKDDDLKKQEDRMLTLKEHGLTHSLKKRKSNGSSKDGKSTKKKKV